MIGSYVAIKCSLACSYSSLKAYSTITMGVEWNLDNVYMQLYALYYVSIVTVSSIAS